MTPWEFRNTQAQIGCTGTTLAQWLGVSAEHISRLRCGHKPVTAQTAALMKALATGWRP